MLAPRGEVHAGPGEVRLYRYSSEAASSECGGRVSSYTGTKSVLELGPVCGPCANAWMPAWVKSPFFYIALAMAEAASPLAGMDPLIALVAEYCGHISPDEPYDEAYFRGYRVVEDCDSEATDFGAVAEQRKDTEEPPFYYF